MFYSDGFQRKVPKTTWGEAKKFNPPVFGAAFQDSFQRRNTEYPELQGRPEVINSYLDIPEKVEIDLSKATLAKLLEVDVPNPDDTSWLQEKQRIITRLKADGKNPKEIAQSLLENPPLGRQQFTRKEERSLASANIPLDKKIGELMQEVREGRTTSDKQRADMIVQLVSILSKADKLEELIRDNKPQIQGLLGGVPKGITYQDFNMKFRGMDATELKKHTGPIAILVLKQALESNIGIEEPVLVQSDAKNPDKFDKMKLSTLYRQTSKKSYLDLFTEDGKIIWRTMDFIPQIKVGLKTKGLDDDKIQELFSFDISGF